MTRVKKYINLGCTMYGGDKNSNHEKFLFSFFELTNGNMISVMLVENWNKEKITDFEFDCYKTNFKFGQKWEDWWKFTFTSNKDTFANKEDKQCVRLFYTKNLLKKRHIKTDVIENNIN